MTAARFLALPLRPWTGPDGAVSPTASLWDDGMLIGHPDIDRDHRTLFAIIRRVDELAATEASVDAVSEVLCQLADYSREHFAREENLMRLSRFPRCTEHVVEHYKFIRKLTVLVDIFERGRPDVIPECRAFLGDWFVGHISLDDMEFGAHLRAIAASHAPA